MSMQASYEEHLGECVLMERLTLRKTGPTESMTVPLGQQAKALLRVFRGGEQNAPHLFITSRLPPEEA
jgi:hypothetical protein